MGDDLHLLAPDLYRMCGTCVGSGKVTEINADGKPVRVTCRNCRGSGSIRKPVRPTAVGEDENSDLDTDQSESDDDEIESSPAMLELRYRQLREEAEAVKSRLLRSIQGCDTIDNRSRLTLSARIFVLDPAKSDWASSLDELTREMQALGLADATEALTSLSEKFVQLYAIRSRLQSH